MKIFTDRVNDHLLPWHWLPGGLWKRAEQNPVEEAQAVDRGSRHASGSR